MGSIQQESKYISLNMCHESTFQVKGNIVMRNLQRLFLNIFITFCSILPALTDNKPVIDLANAIVVAPAGLTVSENKAVSMLIEEVEKRTWIQLTRQESWPQKADAIIAVGPVSSLKEYANQFSLTESKEPLLPEGYRIWIDKSKSIPIVVIAGNDSRGVLFGVGDLLRKLHIQRNQITLDANTNISTSPKYPLRGHQLGYRPKTNSYDGWSLPMWEQYIRDLAVFGTNAVELIPPRSDDDADSPHFPRPPLEMMIGMSRILDEYGMDVWIWYPALDDDYSDPKTVEFALKEWGEIFKQLPPDRCYFGALW